MSNEANIFLKALKDERLKNGERAVALLWFHGRVDHTTARTPSQLAGEIESAGYPTQNVTRLRDALSRSSDTAKAGKAAFRVKITARAKLDKKFINLSQGMPIQESDSILPRELFNDTRGYIENVVRQVNSSFDSGLYDCCAVMCRRLLETLIIESFESSGKESKLKGKDGHYMMFSGLIAVVESGKTIKLSRNGLQGLKQFKKLGDLSAHNRRFNALANDITRIRDGIRVSCEELLHLEKLA